MVLFCIITLAYSCFLIFYRPAPLSLKEPIPSVVENIPRIKASLITGVVLLCIYLVVSRFSFSKVDENLFLLLTLNNIQGNASLLAVQLWSHLLIHESLMHLSANVIGIGLASLYERRVGSTRYMMVLSIGAIASIPSILFYSGQVITCGISGGVFALGAAYFTDNKNFSPKEWLNAIMTFVFLVVILGFLDAMRDTNTNNGVNIDHIGHALGAISGIIYCRARPLK